ncbi:carboxypeptidase B-like isoform X1 [Hydractinia symbiolongicarpus]|uniref:carboxypeptidase B-like isoform X1 n=2 Tax=Hydractinia symbiolongicarpus TaxID=13093 RepID=UPI002550E9E5|nr:carboxypeptidase B-like isoform X1 [Hydractinia symbiolongicarpus]
MHLIWYVTCFLIGCIPVTWCVNVTSNGQPRVMLIRVVPNTTQQLEFLKTFKQQKHGLRLQLWRHPDVIERHVDIWLSGSSYDAFEKVCIKKKINFEIVHNNIYNEIKKENISMKNIEDFEDYYQRFEEIEGEIKRLSIVFNTSTTLEIIGKSYEGRNIYSLKIHKNASDEKPIIFINCGSHSREWLGIAACQYTMRRILFDQQYDDYIAAMLKDFDVVIVPVLNPDGYVFSHRDRYRLWRKSRSPTPESHCFGVDINRNFDYRWGGGGSSRDPCDEIYCGTRPFSENESLALARYLYKHRRKLKAFMDVHTYGQMWMSPWGYTKMLPRHYVEQRRAMRAIQQAIEKAGKVRYRIGTSSTTLYHTSGDALDWVYGRLGILYTFAIELRPSLRARRGFRHTRLAIAPTGKDLFSGLTTLASVIVSKNNARKKHY